MGPGPGRGEGLGFPGTRGGPTTPQGSAEAQRMGARTDGTRHPPGAAPGPDAPGDLSIGGI